MESVSYTHLDVYKRQPGEPLGAFVAAYVAIEVGHLVAGKPKVAILVTPLISICAGAAIGLFVGPYITDFMKWLGGLVNVNVEQSPIFGGIIVSVLMGMICLLYTSASKSFRMRLKRL